MAQLSPSAFLRDTLEDQFAAVYNPNLAAACMDRQCTDLAYEIVFVDEGAVTPAVAQNFYRADKSLDTLEQKDEPDLPAMAMWIGPGIDMRASPESPKPSNFYGRVTAYWRIWLFAPGSTKQVQESLTPLREATESAMIATLNGGLPDDLGFRGDLSWGLPKEATWVDMDQQLVGWVQELEYTASFDVQL